MKYYSVLPLHRYSKQKTRGQSSLEFAVLAGMFMIMFVAFFYVISERIVAFQEQRNARVSVDILEKTLSELSIAFKVRDGYNRTFWLPLELYGQPYSIQFGDHSELQLEYKERTYVMPLLINITDNSQIVRGRNRIQKYRGNITILPAP